MSYFKRCVFSLYCALCLAMGAVVAAEESLPRVSAKHPGLTTGILREAQLGELPEGGLLRVGDWTLTEAMVKERMSTLPEPMQKQSENYLFIIVEGMATEEILTREAAGDAATPPTEAELRKLTQTYFEKVVGEVSVSPEEIQIFYDENKELFTDRGFDEVKSAVEGHLKQTKQEEAWEEHIGGMGLRVPIIANASWVEEQARRLKDNPVDRARTGGKPTLANFSADWCAPCRALKPTLISLQERYGEKVSFVLQNVDEDPFLAHRFSASSVPLLIFYDKDGNEKHRSTGVMTEEEILQQFKILGVE